MTITLTKPVRIGGVEVPAGTNYCYKLRRWKFLPAE